MATERELQFRGQPYEMYNANKRVLIPQDHYETIIGEILECSGGTKKSARQYYLLRKYEVFECGTVKKLIRKREGDEDPVYFATIEETFDVIQRAHTATGHGGRDKMQMYLSEKYANIMQEALNIFKSSCIRCHQKKKRTTTKGIVVKPIISKDFRSRAQIDLIDMQSMRQVSFKWILHYQDHLTKFSILKPLTSKRAAEVAYQLLDIFLLIGAPAILQSDNGSEFTAEIIKEVCEMWPDLTIVHGKP